MTDLEPILGTLCGIHPERDTLGKFTVALSNSTSGHVFGSKVEIAVHTGNLHSIWGNAQKQAQTQGQA